MHNLLYHFKELIMSPKFFKNETVNVSDVFTGTGNKTGYIKSDASFSHVKGAYFYVVIMAITGERYFVNQKFLTAKS